MSSTAPGLQSTRLDRAQQRLALLNRKRDGLFRIDMLARSNCLFQRGLAVAGRCGIEENGISRVGQCGVEIGGPFRAETSGKRGEVVCVAAGQQKPRHDAFAADRKSAFVTDRHQRIGDVLCRGNAAGRAVDDDTDGSCCRDGHAGGVS